MHLSAQMPGAALTPASSHCNCCSAWDATKLRTGLVLLALLELLRAWTLDLELQYQQYQQLS